MQPATDGTSTRQMLADIFPLHTVLTELDDFGIFVWGPFRLLFRRGLG
jgi:hypothetical protein